jgi:hypothetical protein
MEVMEAKVMDGIGKADYLHINVWKLPHPPTGPREADFKKSRGRLHPAYTVQALGLLFWIA